MDRFRYQEFITRADLKTNPDTLYLFGDNDARRGFGGQAKAMRGEPNALGVRTKRYPSTHPSAYYSDEDFHQNVTKIAEDLAIAAEWLNAGGTIVVPSSGLGTGLSRLAELAPRTFKFLEDELARLQLMANETVDKQDKS